MSRYVRQLEEVVLAVRISSASTFSWFGQRAVVLPRRLRAGLPAEDLWTYLRHALADRIYRDAYCVGGARPSRPAADRVFRGRDRRFSEALAAANEGRGAWEPGWRVGDADDGLYAVQRGGLRLWVVARDLRCGGGEPCPGEEVALRLPRGSFDISPGYYCAYGDQPLFDVGDGDLVRVYLAVRPACATAAVRLLTGALNDAAVPFRLKVLSDPDDHVRADSAVLYLPAGSLAAATGPVAAAVGSLAGALAPDVPAFTRPLAPGLALAEEPAARESFGEHRCSLIADGLLAAARLGAGTDAERLGHVIAAWREGSVDVRRPYLTAGSDDSRYDGLAEAVAAAATSHRAAATVSRPGAPLASPAATISWPVATGPRAGRGGAGSVDRHHDQVVDEIAGRLVDSAVWHEDRCTWLGLVPGTDEQGRPGLSHGAVGRTLYDGSAGIALFLAAVGASRRRPDVLAAARAAARHGVAVPVGVSPTAGLYTGITGSALAAAAVGVVVGDPALLDLAARAAHRPAAHVGWDLLSGRAGTVIALLTLARLLNDDALVLDAARLGDEVLAAANRSPQGWSWSSPVGGRSPDLTGLSHGAAGVAVALLELLAATGDERYAEAAREGFRYERSWFSNRRGNWPDLRDRDTRSRRTAPTVFLSQWCHGAPGIALSRLRASAVLGDGPLREESVVALRTTIRDTEAACAGGTLSHSLCHGLAGNADVLLDGRAALVDADRARAGRLIDRVSTTGRARHLGTGVPWPCGVPVPDQEVPGLMLGLAGIGYHYLRLTRPAAVPSVLLPQPRSAAAALARLASGAAVDAVPAEGGSDDRLRGAG